MSLRDVPCAFLVGATLGKIVSPCVEKVPILLPETNATWNNRIQSSNTISSRCCRILFTPLTQNVFWPFVREHYEDVLPQDIAMMAASHFLSIVPLHENRHHQARFLEACMNILSRQGPLLG